MARKAGNAYGAPPGFNSFLTDFFNNYVKFWKSGKKIFWTFSSLLNSIFCLFTYWHTDLKIEMWGGDTFAPLPLAYIKGLKDHLKIKITTQKKRNTMLNIYFRNKNIERYIWHIIILIVHLFIEYNAIGTNTG